MSLILSGTDGLSDVDGTAATPAIRGTDANTGIFFPAADTIGFSEGGAEVARFDSSGNFGIGTSSPAQTLHVKTSTSATPITLGVLSNATGLPALSLNGAYASTTMAGIYANGATSTSLYYMIPSGQNHFFGIADVTKMTLNSDGNIKLSNNISVGGATPTTSGAGITFPATQSASSDAKTLDDYEEGSHTTTANANTTLDNSYRAFKYTKVGNVVNVVGLLQITGSTGSTTLTFTLPFTAAADQTNGQTRSVGGCLPSNATTGTVMVPFVQNNTAVMNLYKITLGTATNSSYAAATNADVINGSSINFNITYLTT